MSSTDYIFDSFSADIQRRLLFKEETPIPLSAKAFDLLTVFLESPSQTHKTNDLIARLWTDTIVGDTSLSHCVGELRKALKDDPKQPKYILTIPREGYRFIADVRQVVIEQPELPIEDSPAEERSSTLVPTPSKYKKPIMVALCIVGLLVIIGFTFWLRRTPTPPVESANAQEPGETPKAQSLTQLTTGSGLTLFPSISRDGNRVAYSSDRNGSFEIYVSQITAGAREIELTSDGQQNFQPAWSPDGQHIAFHSRNRGGIWVIPAIGGKARQLSEFGSKPSWSPDGALIAFQSNGLSDLALGARNALPPSTLWTIPAQGGEPQQITQPGIPEGGHGSPSWSPDGRRIVFEVDQFDGGAVWSVSLNGGDLKRISPGRGYDPIYAPDGKAVYFTRGGLRVVRIAPESGEPLSDEITVGGPIPAPPIEIRYPSISGDGKRIVYSALLQNSNVWSLRLSPDGQPRKPSPLTDEANTRNSFLGFSSDGRKITYDSGRTGAGFDIWVMNSDGRKPIQVTTHPNPSDLDRLPSWFPGGDEIAFLSKRNNGPPKIMAVTLEGGKERELLDLGSDVDFFRLSPDGKQVAFTKKQSGVINTWTVPIEEGEARQLTFDKEMAGFPAWSPDGKWLALELKRGDDMHIAIIPSGGGEPIQITFDHGQSWLHSWSPDGDKIVFAGLRDGYWNVWWVSRSTKEQRQLTDYKKLNAFVRYPAWSPRGEQIVYEYTVTIGNVWMVEVK